MRHSYSHWLAVPGTGNLRSRVLKGMISRAFVPLALLIANGLAQTPDVVIRSSAREVLLDVIVRDTHGKLVTSLKPEEIAVYEDGVRQDVRSFRLVAGKEVRVEDKKQAAEARGLGANPAPASAPSFNPLRTVNVVCLILNDLNPDTRASAFDSARKFVNNELRPNTYIGVFSLDASGLRPVLAFSNNRENLLKAVRLAAVNQLPSINLGTAAMFNGLSMSATGIAGIGTVGPMATAQGFADGASPDDPLGLRGDMGLSTNAGLRENDALIGLVRQLSQLPFQKTVMLMGTGLTRPADLTEYWDSLIHQAVAGGITFYAMDAYGLGVCQDDSTPDPCMPHSAMAPVKAMLGYVAGLSQGQGASTATAAAGAYSPTAQSSPTAQLAELAHEDDYLKFTVASANRQEAIRELAERTGGFLIANTNNADQLLSHVMEEVDTHYEIAYPPKSERDDGHFRKIEVKLARQGLRVETRSGYFAVPDTGHALTPEEMAGLRELDTQPRPHAFDFLSRSYRFRDSGGHAQYAIAFEMPISNLTATAEETAHTHRYHASLLALVKNADGAIVDRVSKDVPSEVSDDLFEKVRWEFMTYQKAVNLPPAHYTVETAVVDHEGNRVSTGTFEIDNRQQRAVGLSDLAVVRKLENLTTPADPADPFEYTGKRVLPFVTSNLLPGTQPFMFFMIYPEAGNGAKPVLRVRLLKDGRTIATLKPDVAAPDASGGIPMLLKLNGQAGQL
jgi:VWFA-related protein